MVIVPIIHRLSGTCRISVGHIFSSFETASGRSQGTGLIETGYKAISGGQVGRTGPASSRPATKLSRVMGAQDRPHRDRLQNYRGGWAHGTGLIETGYKTIAGDGRTVAAAKILSSYTSSTPALQHSIAPSLQHSSTPLLHHSITPVLHCSNSPNHSFCRMNIILVY